ncbi:hypothetical protein [Microseira wollei]|uniref:hypothetical protein n=1 Tax=Microseira wollei TaxID=467598 RepID=UPI001CFEDE85|nr:hypothetical protein [Microseira wollei]
MIWQTKCRGTAAAIWGINQQITVAVPLPQDGGGNLGHQPKDYGCPAPTPGRRQQSGASTKRLRLPCPYPRTAAAILGINQQITVAVPLPQDGNQKCG